MSRGPEWDANSINIPYETLQRNWEKLMKQYTKEVVEEVLDGVPVPGS